MIYVYKGIILTNILSIKNKSKFASMSKISLLIYIYVHCCISRNCPIQTHRPYYFRSAQSFVFADNEPFLLFILRLPLKGEESLHFLQCYIFFFPHLVDKPPGIAKNFEVQKGGVLVVASLPIVVQNVAHRGRTAMGELPNTIAPVMDLGILSNKNTTMSKNVNSPFNSDRQPREATRFLAAHSHILSNVWNQFVSISYIDFLRDHTKK